MTEGAVEPAPEAAAPRRLRAALAALGERDFRLLFAGQAVSLLGTGMVGVALSFAVLDATGSVADLGFVLASRTIALALFLLPGGVVADRLSRRAVMVASDVVRLASQGLLAALVISGSAQIWQFCVLQAVGGAAFAFFLPAVTGLTPQIVGAERLQEANALRSFTNSAGNVAGPAIAGLLVAAVGPGYALAADAASFALSAAFLAALRPRPAAASATALRDDLVAGWRAFRSRRWLLVANAHAAAMNMLVLAPFYVLGPAVAKRSLGGARDWALIVSAFGCGLVLGSLTALHLRPRRRMRLGLGLGVLFAPALALLALRASTLAIAAVAVLAGAQLTLLNTFWETTLQEQIPPALISRVTALDWMSSIAIQPLGYALAGVLAASILGVAGTLWLAAGVALVSSLVVAALPSIRNVVARSPS
jgi:MFS family permease